MYKIMFVCHGNICRSPMAEFIMKDLIREAGLEDKITVSSSATSTEEIGNTIYPPAKKELIKHGIQFSERKAKQLKCEDFDAYDLFVGMDERNIQNMKRILKNEEKIQKLLKNKDVSDPWYTGDFEITYTDLKNGCQKLLNSTKSLLKN